ncbi:MAG: hypothetical protein FVQ82_16215, partial [Planctomycetes bacterium]|nr:hypothetical protein [Planctomycetota bacterium]
MDKFKTKSNTSPTGQVRLTIVTILMLVMMAASTVIAEDAGAAGPDEKSLRYYKVLLRRSESGYVFDRFCNSFLDT